MAPVTVYVVCCPADERAANIVMALLGKHGIVRNPSPSTADAMLALASNISLANDAFIQHYRRVADVFYMRTRGRTFQQENERDKLSIFLLTLLPLARMREASCSEELCLHVRGKVELPFGLDSLTTGKVDELVDLIKSRHRAVVVDSEMELRTRCSCRWGGAQVAMLVALVSMFVGYGYVAEPASEMSEGCSITTFLYSSLRIGHAVVAIVRREKYSKRVLIQELCVDGSVQFALCTGSPITASPMCPVVSVDDLTGWLPPHSLRESDGTIAHRAHLGTTLLSLTRGSLAVCTFTLIALGVTFSRFFHCWRCCRSAAHITTVYANRTWTLTAALAFVTASLAIAATDHGFKIGNSEVDATSSPDISQRIEFSIELGRPVQSLYNGSIALMLALCAWLLAGALGSREAFCARRGARLLSPADLQQLALLEPIPTAVRAVESADPPILVQALQHVSRDINPLVIISGVCGHDKSQTGRVLPMPKSAEISQFVRGQNIRVFLSYQWDHKAFVTGVEAALRTAGMHCWMDTSMMAPGDELFKEISAGILSCDVFIAFLSPQYLQSPNCLKELRFAVAKRIRMLLIIVHQENGREPSISRARTWRWESAHPMAMELSRTPSFDFSRFAASFPVGWVEKRLYPTGFLTTTQASPIIRAIRGAVGAKRRINEIGTVKQQVQAQLGVYMSFAPEEVQLVQVIVTLLASDGIPCWDARNGPAAFESADIMFAFVSAAYTENASCVLELAAAVSTRKRVLEVRTKGYTPHQLVNDHQAYLSGKLYVDLTGIDQKEPAIESLQVKVPQLIAAARCVRTVTSSAAPRRSYCSKWCGREMCMHIMMTIAAVFRIIGVVSGIGLLSVQIVADAGGVIGLIATLTSLFTAMPLLHSLLGRHFRLDVAISGSGGRDAWFVPQLITAWCGRIGILRANLLWWLTVILDIVAAASFLSVAITLHSMLDSGKAFFWALFGSIMHFISASVWLSVFALGKGRLFCAPIEADVIDDANLLELHICVLTGTSVLTPIGGQMAFMTLACPRSETLAYSHSVPVGSGGDADWGWKTTTRVTLADSIILSMWYSEASDTTLDQRLCTGQVPLAVSSLRSGILLENRLELQLEGRYGCTTGGFIVVQAQLVEPRGGNRQADLTL